MRLLVFTIAACAVASNPPAKKAPDFECMDSKAGKYLVWTDPKSRALEIQSANGKKIREISLSEPNTGRGKSRPGEPIAFNEKLPGKKDLFSQLNLSTEFSTQYVVQKDTTTIKIALILDDAEIPGLVCKSANSAATVAYVREGTTHSRNALLFNRSSALRDGEGDLTPGGMMMAEAAIRRMVKSGSAGNRVASDGFVEGILENVRKITPTSVAFLGNRLPDSAKPYWKAILSRAQYEQFPETQRYLSWLTDALLASPRDIGGIRTAFTAFTHSKIFDAPDLRAFFEKESFYSVGKLTKAEVAAVQEGMDAKTSLFFTELWGNAAGKRTLASYPAIQHNLEQMAKNVASDEKKFDPSKTKEQIFWFFSSQWAKDEEARALYMEVASRIVSKLTPRQREDLNVWLSPAEKKFFQENFK